MNHRSVSSKRVIEALDQSYAIIEFQPDGTILAANKNFLDAMGYAENEIVGAHHRIFMDPAEAGSHAYKKFWKDLASGLSFSKEFKRVTKSGQDIWIEASYNPVRNAAGEVVKVVKLAADRTEVSLKRIDSESQIDAISRSQAVVEFDLKGRVLKTNPLIQSILGYTEEDLVGSDFSKFCDRNFPGGPEYGDLWQKLSHNEFQTGEYLCVDKPGQDVWLSTSFNPVLDLQHRPFKVLMLATDVTKTVKERAAREAIQGEISAQLHTISEAISASSTEATAASGASDTAADNVQAVATGAEELAASFDEIGHRVTEALSVSQDAVQEAERTRAVVAELSNAADSISKVVELINSIADQTNLLALNATIEAARAGEAGKGFAVVASEVKGLAGQTSKAIDDITTQISAVQHGSTGSAEAIESISTVISRVDDIATGIASAVEEQSVVTRSISSNMATASQGVSDVNAAVNSIAEAAQQAETATQAVPNIAAKLA
jgi:methyl-accepting chemotaxis protein